MVHHLANIFEYTFFPFSGLSFDNSYLINATKIPILCQLLEILSIKKMWWKRSILDSLSNFDALSTQQASVHFTTGYKINGTPIFHEINDEEFHQRVHSLSHLLPRRILMISKSLKESSVE